jgi:hypothetical protein
MSSELLGAAQNVLKGNLGGAWDINKGYADAYTDLGVARRFGGSSAAYSLRDIGAMNGPVVKVRRDSDDTEENFSAAQITSGALETFVQDGATYNDFSGNPVAAGAAADQVTLSNVSSSGFTAVIGAGSGTKQINFPLTSSLSSGTDFFVSFDYTTTNSGITVGVKPRKSDGGSASGDVISATIDGFYGTTGDTTHGGYDISATATVLTFQTTSSNFTFTVSNLKASTTSRNGFVRTWYDQSGNGNDANQSSATIQPVVVSNGGLAKLNNGTPSVGFERRGSSDRRIELSTELTAEPYTFITVGVARGTQPIHILRENATLTSTANRPQINIGKTNMKYDADPSTTSGNITVDGDNDFIASFLSSTNGSTADMRFNKSSVNTFTRGAVGNGIGFIGKFDNTSTPFTMVESWIVYEADLSNDIAEIENEITRPIGL